VTPSIKPTPDAVPRRVLFVGNSYLYYGDGMHNHVRRLANAADSKLQIQPATYKSATISGSVLRDHNIRAYLEPGRLRVNEPFEIVVLQGGSAEASATPGRAEFEATVIDFDKEIRRTGARTALYMTHAYAVPHEQADPGMMRDLEALYVSTANKVGALVIPVGLAFEQAYRSRPGLRLHKAHDGSHPDLVGTYLAACVTYACLYGRSPVGNSYDYYGAIDKDAARFMQEVAEQTVTAFYR
jgi:hypothetical protein